MNRRRFLQLAGASAAASGFDRCLASPAPSAQAAFSLRIASASVELAPGKVVHTLGYNGQVPGPLLRVREGIPVAIDVFNGSADPEWVHWHGVHIGPGPDGAISPGERRRYSFIPKPAGTRWYHTPKIAGANLTRASYTGQFGFLYIEPRSEPGAYDRVVFLALHHWEPSFAKNPGMRDECPRIEYRYASFNDKLLGEGEPIRVRRGERVLFRLLNASPTEDVMLSLPGHRFTVIALDGNPVPIPRSVEVLSLAVGERVDALVEMANPGKWVLGSITKAERAKGLGIVIEYANRGGSAEWSEPERQDWSYALFSATNGSTPAPDETVVLMFEKNPNRENGSDRWTINGKPFPGIDPLYLKKGNRYRLRLLNASAYHHPIHLQHDSFELVRVNQMSVSGIWKDTVQLDRYNAIDANIIANRSGPAFLDCRTCSR